MPFGAPSFIRALIATVAVVLTLGFRAAPAFAWVELTVSNDDVRVEIEPTGKARVEHRVTLLVSGGPLKEVTLKGIDADAEVQTDGYVMLEKDASKKGLDGALPITAERVLAAVPENDHAPPRTDLKVTLAPGEGLRRGAYILLVRYTTDMKAQGTLSADGATMLLRWTGPAWDDGLDATKAAFVFPSAPTAPKVPDDADDNAGGYDVGTVLSNVHRDGKKDIVDLARPYSPKGERAVWTLRVDARAFASDHASNKPSAKPTDSPRGLRVGIFGNPRDGLLIGLGLAAFALMAFLVTAKSLEVRRLASERGGLPVPLVPLPLVLRAPLSGLALVGGVLLEMTHKSSLPGALLVAACALLAAERSPRYRQELRGPGQWLPVSVTEALRSEPVLPTARLDASTWTGRLLLALLLSGVAAATAFLWPISRYYAVLVALDATPFLAVFFTGRLDQLLPDLAVAPVPFFRRVVRFAERAYPGIRIVPRVRVPAGSADSDELRIALLPIRPVRGLFAVEIGVSYAPGLGGYSMLPEILVRYQSKSDCEARASGLAQHGRIQRGRKPEERVLSLSPKLPTARMTASLAVALLRALAAEERPSVSGAGTSNSSSASPKLASKRSLAA